MKKILIVDDEMAYVDLLKETLSEKYEVYTARDGKAGLKMIAEKKPDLVLLDINMPVMNGMLMLKELRKDEFGKNLKVFFLTNLEPNPEIIRQSIEDKPLMCVVKSETSLAELQKNIDQALS